MYKKLILLSTLLIAGLEAKIYFPENVSMQDLQSQKPTYSIAWDIHNVLAKKECGTLAKIGLVFKTAPRAMAHALYEIAYTKITGKPTATANAYKEIKNLPKSADSSGEAYVQIFARHNLHQIANAVEKVSNTYKPQPGISEIVQTVKNQNIEQRLASNIGPRLLANLQEKFKNQFNNSLFDSIQNGKIVNYKKDAQLESHLASIGKPNPQFYKEYNDTYNNEKNKMIVFIDDSLANIQAATQAGWIGIHFDYKHNPAPMDELKKDLSSLGIIV